ncbi:MAG: 3-oxoadipate CoA-transferase subunit B [Alphaproteobacteria bacterium ADurb.BinA280]|jgi:glutaconate CoA-transferase subunit B|nr:CoA-transferase subunit beta [Aquimonas sp.]OPZ13215.1 MAG: 3-oxoadipate CoA-transferase subunit B [Alphaproteobacteria bacterium ADurb.BinA280]
MSYTADEMMTIAAARQLRNGDVCFVGIGLPGAACNLARMTHAPDLVLIYESGTVGTRPERLPLSIGDGELAQTAAYVVSLPEVFAYYLQAGRVDIGFLGAAQMDRFGNLNSTAIGDYAQPHTRLPGAGGAPEIAAHAAQTFVVMKANPRSMVEALDFRTSGGFLEGHGTRQTQGLRGAGPQVVITDIGILRPAPGSQELQLHEIYPGASVEQARAAFGWPLQVTNALQTLGAPSARELETLRALQRRSAIAHLHRQPLPLHLLDTCP